MIIARVEVCLYLELHEECISSYSRPEVRRTYC